MKVYNLESLKSDAVYFITLEENGSKSIECLIFISEIMEHSQYSIHLIKTKNNKSADLILSRNLISTPNIASIGANFLSNQDDITKGLVEEDV
jgi:hypothetical protein